MSDLIERGNKILERPRNYSDSSLLDWIEEAIEALSPVITSKHEWIDPSNEKVDAGEYRLCLKCNAIGVPPESPVLPDDVVSICVRLLVHHDRKPTKMEQDAADVLERQARDIAAYERYEKTMGKVVPELQQRIEQLEDYFKHPEKYPKCPNCGLNGDLEGHTCIASLQEK